MRNKTLFIRINESYYIGADYGVTIGKDKAIDLLFTVTSDKNISFILEEMAKRWYKGRYYSTPKNYYSIMEVLNIAPVNYIEAITSLISYGVIREVKERVYELNNGFHIVSQEDLNKTKDGK